MVKPAGSETIEQALALSRIQAAGSQYQQLPSWNCSAGDSGQQALTRVLAFRNTWLSISLLDLLWATPAFLMASSLKYKRRAVYIHSQVYASRLVLSLGSQPA